MPIHKKSAAFLCFILLLATAAALVVRLRAANSPPPKTALAASRMAGFPKLFLWAWERPEHLEFINPREVGVAFLASTIYLRGEKIIERPRLQPLKTPKGTTLIAVVRIESVREEQPLLSTVQRASVVEALAAVAGRPGLAALQIDFDATESERKFYRDILIDLRKQMPESMPLSITALASWCIFDNWLEELPIDEAVPMLFQLGIDQKRIQSYLQTGGDFRSQLCRQSVGISTDETITTPSSTTRLYIFNSVAWSETSVRDALERKRQ